MFSCVGLFGFDFLQRAHADLRDFSEGKWMEAAVSTDWRWWMMLISCSGTLSYSLTKQSPAKLLNCLFLMASASWCSDCGPMRQHLSIQVNVFICCSVVFHVGCGFFVSFRGIFFNRTAINGNKTQRKYHSLIRLIIQCAVWYNNWVKLGQNEGKPLIPVQKK